MGRLKVKVDVDLNKVPLQDEHVKKEIPQFKPGDTLRVHTIIKEGDKERIQIFQGVCIARHNNGAGSTFTVRKISSGVGVEKIFKLYSPLVKKIEVLSRGKVRRAKLFYLRGRSTKEARIKSLDKN